MDLSYQVKRLGQALIGKAGSSSACWGMAKTGVKLCKALAEPSEKIEDLLFSPNFTIKDSDVYQCIKNARQPFKKLEEFMKELQKIALAYMEKKEIRSALKDKKIKDEINPTTVKIGSMSEDELE